MPGLKAVLKVKPVISNHSAFCKLFMREKKFYTYVVIPLSRLQWYIAKSTKKYHLFQQIILVFIVNFDGKSISVNQWLLAKVGQESVRISSYLPTWISFPSCKAQVGMNGGKERNDSIPSQEECQDLGNTKAKEKSEEM